MIAFFCPDCWREVEPGARECPGCGAALADLDGQSYERKLIAALAHPLPDRQMLAARILGQLRSQAAVSELEKVVEFSPDPYLAAEAVTALARIGGNAATKAVKRAERDERVVVRAAAKRVGVIDDQGDQRAETRRGVDGSSRRRR